MYKARKHNTNMTTTRSNTLNSTRFSECDNADVFFVSFSVPIRGGQSLKVYTKDFLKEKHSVRIANMLSTRRRFRDSVQLHLTDDEGHTYTYSEDTGIYEHDNSVFENASRPYYRNYSGSDTTATDGQQTEADTSKPFSGMFVEAHGKGFLMFPGEARADAGTKYYHGGWWMPRYNAWFFKREFFDTLIQGGATERIVIDSDSETTTTTTSDATFNSMALETYGRGYLLTPPEDHADAGTKYYHGGWWKPSLGGWFFRKEHYETLVNGGAEHLTEGEDEYYDISLSGMTFQKYGKGFLLKPQSDSPFTGIKEFMGGWWMPKHNAWFFKAEFKDTLLDYGATASSASTRRVTRSSTR